jgi:ABC transport system ATP-binding/permease protein
VIAPEGGGAGSNMPAAIPTCWRSAADPQLYARDRATFTSATADLAACESRLAAAEEQWLELEILREEIEGKA